MFQNFWICRSHILMQKMWRGFSVYAEVETIFPYLMINSSSVCCISMLCSLHFWSTENLLNTNKDPPLRVPYFQTLQIYRLYFFLLSIMHSFIYFYVLSLSLSLSLSCVFVCMCVHAPPSLPVVFSYPVFQVWRIEH